MMLRAQRFVCALALALACWTGLARGDVTPPAPKPPPSKPPRDARIRPAIPEPLRAILVEKPRGVIVREQNGRDFYLFDRPKADSFWTPTRDDVAALEKKLPDWLRSKVRPAEQRSISERDWSTVAVRKEFLDRFPDYTRQYIGIVDGKQRWIWVNFFCRDEGVNWTREPVLVKDGGDCFGQLQFEPATGKFRGFSVNGSG
jgi:hypothetical protein